MKRQGVNPTPAEDEQVTAGVIPPLATLLDRLPPFLKKDPANEDTAVGFKFTFDAEIHLP